MQGGKRLCPVRVPVPDRLHDLLMLLHRFLSPLVIGKGALAHPLHIFMEIPQRAAELLAVAGLVQDLMKLMVQLRELFRVPPAWYSDR